mmetsp:Transcript_25986/g.48437  ORF Transcript_25986/g.48437 Transcript_25986/m.48437 type:complete len:158 (-) Transcript_25986:895-1368(-)|eukprot:CAMPEP_0197453066 /NCGR_PEP_ID=MMETSP1175-20131217/33844_1 /TAXON_ID=1003142 /ORGANISM="Triceratium dubium, Strain CCMP147" /LENGTH=157 /DNA_ID=CAMNT_0042986235 /DNA_START=76 /DNA_END=549 /DNA_ORIENTATION=-
MSSALAKNVIAHFEGINKDTASSMSHHEILFNDDSVLKWHYMEAPFQAEGASGIVGVHKGWYTTFPDLDLTLNDVIEQGPDKCAARFDFTTTSPKTGEKMSFQGVLFMTGKDGKMVEGTWHYDATFIAIHGGDSKFGMVTKEASQMGAAEAVPQSTQ